MRSLLPEELPLALDGVPIAADFRNMLRFSRALQDAQLSEEEKARRGLTLLFGELPPGGPDRALELLLWFYCGGRAPEDASDAAPTHRQARAYDFDADADYIYTSFVQAYRIDLFTVDFLHWWEFLALLNHLPEDTILARIMQWRTMDLSQVKDKELRAHYAKLKKQFSLDAPPGPALSLEELTRRSQERVDRRFAEAERRKQEKLQREEAEGMDRARANSESTPF